MVTQFQFQLSKSKAQRQRKSTDMKVYPGNMQKIKIHFVKRIYKYSLATMAIS